jgi:D-alanyl-D-alanine carboxypeptidase
VIRFLPPRVVAAAAGIVIACAACSTAAPPATPNSPTAAPPSSAAATAALPPDVVARIDQLGAAALGNGITGAIVSIADPARGNLLKAYGTSDTAGTPMSADMHYRAA